MTTAPAPQTNPFTNVWNRLAAVTGQIQNLLPGSMRAESFVSSAYLYVKQNPDILKCTADSLLNAILRAAQLGLMLDGSGSAYLVPFYEKKKGLICQMIPGYKGLIDLMRRCAGVRMVETAVVREGDEFEYSLGTAANKYIKHTPRWREAGMKPLVGVYCIVTYDNGDYQFEVMSNAEVETIRNGSKAYDPGKEWCVWIKHFEQMARKCPIRRISNYVPISAHLAMAINLEIQYEKGEEQDVPGTVNATTVARDDAKGQGTPQNLADFAEKEVPAWARKLRDLRGEKPIKEICDGMGWPVDAVQEMLDGIGGAELAPSRIRQFAELCGHENPPEFEEEIAGLMATT